MKKKRILLFGMALTLAVLAVILVLFFRYAAAYRQGSAEYEQLAVLAVKPGKEVFEERNTQEEAGEKEKEPYVFLDIDFSALQAVNPEVVAWLDIPGMEISYPVTQGGDNSYYLHRTFRKTYNFAGCIFMDAANDPSPSADQNLVLYGHNMKNGTMFGRLRKYREKTHYEAHPEFYLYLANGEVYRCRITAGFDLSARASSLPISFTPEMKKQYLAGVEKARWYGTEEDAGQEDALVTLVTCVGDRNDIRLAVQGKAELIRDGGGK